MSSQPEKHFNHDSFKRILMEYSSWFSAQLSSRNDQFDIVFVPSVYVCVCIQQNSVYDYSRHK